MVSNIMQNGFAALSAYTFFFVAISFGLFIISAIVNACARTSRFNVAEIRKVFTTTLIFMTLFAVLDYFLIP